MAYSCGNAGDQNANRNVYTEGQPFDISKTKGDFTIDHSCFFLTKNLPLFCSCPENLNATLFEIVHSLTFGIQMFAVKLYILHTIWTHS